MSNILSNTNQYGKIKGIVEWNYISHSLISILYFLFIFGILLFTLSMKQNCGVGPNIIITTGAVFMVLLTFYHITKAFTLCLKMESMRTFKQFDIGISIA